MQHLFAQCQAEAGLLFVPNIGQIGVKYILRLVLLPGPGVGYNTPVV